MLLGLYDICIINSALSVGKMTNKDFYLLCCKLLTVFIPFLKTGCSLKSDMCPKLKVENEPFVSNTVSSHQLHYIIDIELRNSTFTISVFCTALLIFLKTKLSGFPVLLMLYKDLVLRRKYRVNT